MRDADKNKKKINCRGWAAILAPLGQVCHCNGTQSISIHIYTDRMRYDICADICTVYTRTLIYNAYINMYRHIAYTWFITCIILEHLGLLQIPTAHSDIFRIFLIPQIPAVSIVLYYIESVVQLAISRLMTIMIIYFILILLYIVCYVFYSSK